MKKCMGMLLVVCGLVSMAAAEDLVKFRFTRMGSPVAGYTGWFVEIDGSGLPDGAYVNSLQGTFSGPFLQVGDKSTATTTPAMLDAWPEAVWAADSHFAFSDGDVFSAENLDGTVFLVGGLDGLTEDNDFSLGTYEGYDLGKGSTLSTEPFGFGVTPDFYPYQDIMPFAYLVVENDRELEVTFTGIIATPETGEHPIQEIEYNAYQVLPEPMTLSVLGIGGLLALRRRRK